MRIRRFLARHLLSYLALLVLVVTAGGAVVAREAIRGAWHALPRWTVPVVLGPSLVNYALRFARWQLLLDRLGARVPLRASATIWFGCLAMVVTPARLGELAKLGLLRARFGIPVRRSAAALLVDRASDALGLTALGALGLLLATGGATPALALLAGMLGLLWLSMAPPLRRALVQMMERWRPTRRHAAAVAELLHANARLLAPPSLLPAFALSVLAWLAECVGLYCITSGLGATLRWTEATWIYAAATLVGNLTFVPGGLVGTEVSLVALLRRHQMSAEAAVGAAALVRAATLWFAVALGVLAALVFRRRLQFSKLQELEDDTPPPRREASARPHRSSVDIG